MNKKNLILYFLVGMFAVAVVGCGSKRVVVQPPVEEQEELDPEMGPINKKVNTVFPEPLTEPEIISKRIFREAQESPEDYKALMIKLKKIRNKKAMGVYVVGTWAADRDCLWNISKLVYDDPYRWQRIHIANRDQIDDPDVIHPKQRLIIP